VHARKISGPIDRSRGTSGNSFVSLGAPDIDEDEHNESDADEDHDEEVHKQEEHDYEGDGEEDENDIDSGACDLSGLNVESAS
jgi:hypothetical protein